MAKTTSSTTNPKAIAKLEAVAKGAYGRSRKKEVKSGGGGLPANIRRGVARFTSYKVDLDKKGSPYVALTGIVVEPEDFAGSRCTKMHFIKATKNATVDDKMDKLCADISNMTGEDLSSDDYPTIKSLIGVLDENAKPKPYFLFDTWMGRATKEFPNPEVQTTILGPTEYEGSEPDEEEGDENDEEEGAEEDNSEENEDQFANMDRNELKAFIKEHDPEFKVMKNHTDDELREHAATLSPEEEGEEEEEEGEPEGGEEEETEEAATSKKNPTRKTSRSKKEEELADEDAMAPATGDIYGYKPPKAKAEVNVKVLLVDKKNETVNVKEVKTQKLHKAVPWSKLAIAAD